MTPEEAPPPREREDTDEGLRVEREKTDRELAKKREAVAGHAEAVLERARDRASEILDAARAKADERLEADGASTQARARVTDERARDDHALEHAQAASDARLTDKLAGEVKDLGDLLERERATTDEFLRVERARADRAVTTRDDFLAMVSHDVRTLLTSIAMETEIMIRSATREAAGEKPALKAAEKISRLTGRMTRLVGDLVDVVSIDAGKLSVALEPDDASRLGQETLDALAPAAAARGLTIDAGVSGGPLRASFDHDRMLQVLTNLVSNAIKFTPTGGRITIHTDLVEHTVLFSVADTGCGVSEDDLPLMFERFWQAGKEDRRGLGLGLHICKCIVDAHGGRLWAESKLGAGTTVRFTLPVAVSRTVEVHPHSARRSTPGA